MSHWLSMTQYTVISESQGCGVLSIQLHSTPIILEWFVTTLVNSCQLCWLLVSMIVWSSRCSFWLYFVNFQLSTILTQFRETATYNFFHYEFLVANLSKKFHICKTGILSDISEGGEETDLPRFSSFCPARYFSRTPPSKFNITCFSQIL